MAGKNSFGRSRRAGTPSRSAKLADVAEWLAMVSAVTTVAAQPWLLGGVIPLARVVLLFGCISATAFSVVGRLFRRPAVSQIPVAALLAVGIGLLGVIQVMPLFEEPIDSMNHAIYADLRNDLTDLRHNSDSDSGFPRSLSAADTRLAAVQWFCLAMLVLVGAQVISSRLRLSFCLTTMTLNAVAIAITGLLQRFGDGRMILGSQWIRYESVPFATFTNSNNAAGWLCVHLAAAVGLMAIVWGKRVELPYSRPFQKPGLADRLWIGVEILQSRIARLNNQQIIVTSCLVLIVVGIMASLSRGGILAAMAGVFAGIAFRMQFRHALLMLLPLMLVAATGSFILGLFQMDEMIISELSTLSNPLEASTGRLRHWSEVAAALLDFPLIGLGMNNYRFSTLPYVGDASGSWFQHADNQIFEMWVETGGVGLLLYAGIWLTILGSGFRLNRLSGSLRDRDRILLIALSATVVIMAGSAMVTAFLDYGIGFCATSSSIMLLAGAALAPVRSPGRSGLTDEGRSVSLPNWLAVSISWPGAISLQCGLIAAGACFATDLLAAHHVYGHVLAVERVLRKPVTLSSLEALPQLEQDLGQSLRRRPDDADGVRAAALASEAQFRLAFMKRMDDIGAMPDEQFSGTWAQLTPPGLADRLIVMQRSSEQAVVRNVRNQIALALADHPWSAKMKRVLDVQPLMPGVSLDLLCADLLQQTDVLNGSRIRRIIFSEPANDRRLYQAGALALNSGRQDLACEAWDGSLRASEKYRGSILMAAARVWSPEQAVERFGNTRYAATVMAADAVTEPVLRDLLWERAGKLWEEVQDQPTALDCAQRVRHLQKISGNEAAVSWAKQCVEIFPRDFGLASTCATLLEKQEDYRGAYAEWSRIQYFYPRSETVQKALDRLGRRF